MAEMLLAGDVGGTNARLSLLSRDGRKVLRRDALPSREYPSLEAAVRVFLGDDRVKAAAIGVAGPVLQGRCNATNLPWSIDERALSKRLGIPKVTLQNDLVVAAYGALEAPPRTVELLWGERRPRGTGGNVAILAAGTGLGEAALVWDGERHVSLATEGGHVDFAPRSELEARLLLFLRKRLGKRVSYERVLSGPGIGHLYDFFHSAEGARETAPNLTKLAKATDRNAAITELALSKKSRPGARAIDLFMSLLGAEAGNLALKTLPAGGLFIAGNIAGHLFPKLGPKRFLEAFFDKGRMEPLLRRVPVALLTDSDVGLRGSMRLVREL